MGNCLDIKTILLVEDEALIALAESRELERAGYRVIHEATGQSAVDRINSGADTVDLILMDIDLGRGMDGTEAAAEILTNHDIPIVFLSSHTEAQVVDKTEKISSYGYAVKNSGITVITASIKMAFKLFNAHKNIDNQKMEITAAYEELQSTIEELEVTNETLMDSERARAVSEEKYSKVFHKAPILISITDLKDGTYTEVNDMALSISGFTREEVIGRRSTELGWITAENRNRLLELIEKHGKIENIEMDFRNKNGEPVYGIVNGEILSFEGKRMLLTTTAVTTDQIIAEEKFSRIFNFIPDSIAITEIENGKILSANKSFAELTGYSPEDIAGKSGKDLNLWVDESDRDRIISIIRKDGYIRNFETRLRSKNGSITVCLYSACYFEFDRREAVLAIVHDISDLKNAEMLRQKADDELKNFFNLSLDLFCIADTDGFFRKLNPEWIHTLGYELSELEGMRFIDLVHPDDVQPTLDAIQTLANQSEVPSFTNRYRCKDGSYRWIEWSSHPQGSTIFAAARDITQRRLNDESLNQLVAQKEILMKELQHRVKNSLNLITSLLNIEKSKSDNVISKHILNETVNRIHSISSVYEKLYSSEDLVHINLRPYITELTGSIIETFCSSTSNISLSLHLEEVMLDAKRAVSLGLILNELMTNALKYAYPDDAIGEIRIILKKNGTVLHLAVSDDGSGLPESIHPHTAETMGMLLIRMLSQQLEGSLEFTGSIGLSANISFSIE